MSLLDNNNNKSHSCEADEGTSRHVWLKKLMRHDVAMMAGFVTVSSRGQLSSGSFTHVRVMSAFQLKGIR